MCFARPTRAHEGGRPRSAVPQPHCNNAYHERQYKFLCHTVFVPIFIYLSFFSPFLGLVQDRLLGDIQSAARPLSGFCLMYDGFEDVQVPHPRWEFASGQASRRKDVTSLLASVNKR